MSSIHNNKKLYLKWLFSAYFDNGKVIHQTSRDTSSIDPDKRSTFFDVLEYEKNAKLYLFELHNRETGESCTVNLNTGEFKINNSSYFSIADQNFIPCNSLRLIYFRETKVESTVNSGIVTDENFYINRYFIGWQTNDQNGNNIQKTISVK